MSHWESGIADAPQELMVAIQHHWPVEEWDNASSIALLESNWNAFAENDTTSEQHPCGTVLTDRESIPITAEHSIGWFQINACNLDPGMDPRHLFNTEFNCGQAYLLWQSRGWQPWYFSAKTLGLL